MSDTNIIIREAVQSDLDFIVHANNIVNDKSGLNRADNGLQERLESDFFPTNKTRSNARILIAEFDNAPVGMIVFGACYFMKEGDCIWISNEYVDPNYQNMGIGTKLMNQVKEIAIAENYGSICFLEDNDNIPAQQLAVSNGASKVDNLRLFYIKVKA